MRDNEEHAEGESEPAFELGFKAVEDVLRSGFFEGMHRRLSGSFPDLDHQTVEDALYGAAEKCAKRVEPPNNVRAWLYAVAKNTLRDVMRKERPDELTDESGRHHPSAEDQAFPDATYKAVVDYVWGWPTTKMRSVVLLVLEAAHHDVPLPPEELAERASEVMHEPMSVGSAKVHKSRGLARLRDEYPAIFNSPDGGGEK